MKAQTLLLAAGGVFGGLVLAAAPVPAQPKPAESDTAPALFLKAARTALKWDEPAAPHRVVGPVHFVGTQGLGCYLITGSKGHVVLNTGMPGSGPLIEASIRKPGFDPRDVKLILAGHAHVDHVGGHAYLKKATGAKVGMMREEVELFESGGTLDFHYGAETAFTFDPAKVDTVFRDGDEVKVGEVVLTRLADVTESGMVVSVILPLRVRGGKPFYEEPAAFTGVLGRMHPSEADHRQFGFLTKEGTVRPCTPAEAAAVQRNKGVLYHPEVPNTTLYLVLKGKPEMLREIAENREGYEVEVDFSDLNLGKPPAWGFFRMGAYIDAGRDCQKLWADYLADDKNPQPVYFPVALGGEDAEKIPEVVRARLEALRILNKEGTVVGGYRVK
jgi:hypothetical protein